MTSWIYEVAYALFFIFPAYVANAIPVILGGGRPIDGGRKLRDGQPIFGSHKTIRGFIAGVIAGSLTGAAQAFLQQFIELPGFVLPFIFSVVVGILISVGALIGDLAHSFIKRRIGRTEGAPLLIADQLDFVIGAILFSYVASRPTPLTILIIFVITLPVHLLTNLFAYLVGLKKKPL